jgi:hypothetical protein
MFPSLFGLQNIPHYHGDTVRQLFVASAIISLVVIPVFGDLLPYGHLAGIGSALLLVALAGLTNPKSTIVLFLDAIVAATGAFFIEAAAISFYSTDSSFLFLFREVVALMLVIALYSSIKTVRSMSTHDVGFYARIGKKD